MAGTSTPVTGAGNNPYTARLPIVPPPTATPTHTDCSNVGKWLVVTATWSSTKTSRL